MIRHGRPLNVNDEAACFIGKTGGEVEKGALRMKVGGRVFIFQWKFKSRGGSGGVLLHYSNGGWTPLYQSSIDQSVLSREMLAFEDFH